MTKKTTYWVSGILMAGLLAFAACSKSEKAGAQQPSAAMDFTKFRQAFPTPTPEQQQVIAKVSQAIRYRLYPDAVAALAQLSGDASLTDAQKKAVNDLAAGLSQMMTNAPAAPTQ
jgi:hypothetical protein